jgi:hypothetical protein
VIVAAQGSESYLATGTVDYDHFRTGDAPADPSNRHARSL